MQHGRGEKQGRVTAQVARPLKASYHTVGCKLNQCETTRIAELQREAGIAEPSNAANNSPTELIVVNTCGVTQKAAAKSRHLISKLAREYPNATIMATGCLAELAPNSLCALQGVRYVLGTSARFDMSLWRGAPDQTVVATGVRDSKVDSGARSRNPRRSRALLKIQDGCDQNCSYCIIPRLRGKPRSLSEQSVLSDAAGMLADGVHEIVLTGVRIGFWGSDLPGGKSLADLLGALVSLPGDFRIRLGSLEPWELNDDLLDLVLASPKVCKHLHIPLQHTEATVLEGMGRPPLHDTLQKLHALNKSSPNLAIGVDLIAGFPGETESDFTHLFQAIQRLNLARIHAFGYSDRPGTASIGHSGKVDPRRIKERVRLLRELSAQKQDVFIRRQVGMVGMALTERSQSGDRGAWGLTDNYIRLRMPAAAVAGEILPVRIGMNERFVPTGSLVC